MSSNLPAVIPPLVIDRARYYAEQRAFVVGSGVVDASELSFGHDPSSFEPAAYGNYLATSIGVYRAATIRATNIARLPIKFWRYRRNGDLEELTRGQLYELLQRVNPFWTFKKLLRFTELSRCLWGDAYWVLERGRRGVAPPAEVWWVRPDYMRVVPHPTDYIQGYLFQRNGEPIPFLPGEVVRFPMDNPIDEFSGLSPIAAARISIDTAHDAMRSNRIMHKNGSNISGIVGPDDPSQMLTPTQVAQAEAMFGQLYKGVGNSHRLAVVSGAMKVSPLSISPKDAQFIEQLRWTLGDIGRAFGVPAGLMGDREHSTYNNVKEDHKALWADTLIPEADDLGDTMTEFLPQLFPGERIDKITLDYTQIPELQEDRTELTTQASQWYGMGVPLNPLLQEFMPSLLPPGEGGYPWGDTPKAVSAPAAGGDPGAQAASDQAAQDAADSGEPARAALSLVRQLREARRAVEYGGPEHQVLWGRAARRMDRDEARLATALRSLFRRQQESVLARLRKRGLYAEIMTRDDDSAATAPFSQSQWVETFVQELLPLVSDILEGGGSEALADIGVTGSFDIDNPAVRKWLETATQQFAEQVNETTWEALKAALADGIDSGASLDELVETVKGVFATATDSRAETIARTETARATNQGGLEGAKQSGVVSGKTWLSALDNRTRDTHVEAHGQTVGLEDDFTVGGATGPAPGSMGVAEEDINCRCVMTWVLDDGRMIAPAVLRRD